MGSRVGAIFCLSLSQEDWRSAVRSFLGAEKRDVFAIEVSIGKPGGRIIAFDSWTNSERTAADLAEGITEWIDLHFESSSSDDLEATISVCAPARGPLHTVGLRTVSLRTASLRSFEQLGRAIRILALQSQKVILL